MLEYYHINLPFSQVQIIEILYSLQNWEIVLFIFFSKMLFHQFVFIIFFFFASHSLSSPFRRGITCTRASAPVPRGREKSITAKISIVPSHFNCRLCESVEIPARFSAWSCLRRNFRPMDK